MKKFSLPTKKTIALMVMIVICGLSIVQGVVEKKVPTELIGMGGTILGFYFGYGKGQDDSFK